MEKDYKNKTSSKKRIVLFFFIVIVLAIISFFVTKKLSVKKENTDKNMVNDSSIETKNVTNDEKVNVNEKEVDVGLDSKLGKQILTNLKIPMMYSKILNNTLEKEGISNYFMLEYVYSLINTDYSYHLYVHELEDRTGSYILESDFLNVAKNIFGKDIDLEFEDVIYKNNYDKEKSRIVTANTGLASENLEYVINFPYKIVNKEDKYYVYTYKIYAKYLSAFSSDDYLEKNEIYYDEDMKNLILKIEDTTFEDETMQNEFIKENIDNGKIDVDKLEKNIYVFENESSNYILTDYKKV